LRHYDEFTTGLEISVPKETSESDTQRERDEEDDFANEEDDEEDELRRQERDKEQDEDDIHSDDMTALRDCPC
jgi:hypothetical protein